VTLFGISLDPAPEPVVGEAGAGLGVGEPASSRAKRHRLSIPGLIAVTFLVLLVFIAVFAPLLAPHSPNVQDLTNTYQSPGWNGHPLGTDGFGRDVLSRLMYGARVSLVAVLVGTGVAMGIGVPLGIAAAFLGRAVDAAANFVNDAMMSVPALIFALTAIAILGPGLVNSMVAIGIVLSPTFFRLARAATLEVRAQTFIEASHSIGCSTWRTMWRHVLPNSLTPIVIQMAAAAGICVVAEASLSYLGLGVQPPTASWGSMLSSASSDLYSGPYLIYPPGIAVALTVLAFSMAGDWLREVVGTRRRTQA
jgi:ABC-type dipeptide/oligopeptide/nickel transport system permease subunit